MTDGGGTTQVSNNSRTNTVTLVDGSLPIHPGTPALGQPVGTETT